MFGYTIPLYMKMSPSDLSSYRRYYCETCHQLKSEFGVVSTSAVNYDMTFNTIIMNSFTGDCPYFDGTKISPVCVFKDPKADSDLFRKMAAYTILLTKWELVDDKYDKPSIKSSAASVILGKAISKAERKYPEYDDVVGKGFEKLRSMEEAGCSDAVRMGETFGRSLAFALKDIAGEQADDGLENIFTHLTAAVYMMDAVDDLDQDYLDDTYNPLLAGGKPFKNKMQFINDNMYEISGSLNKVIGDLQASYSALKEKMKCDVGVTDNIVYYGIPDSAKNVMLGSSLAKASVKNTFEGRKKRNASY
ncbi:hypothetical protein Mpt1_c03390 [Candidatus Methanoplasma termitum]|uniref:Uncharacterized protein n=1 Tax=Candidatus Methanoplasma termitum TaxID=1577791 RepID=A0A0A7LAP6_9ARCH|nr:DUF5685 family protein [Candidatus Methanoplasma termitum]AIZ56235.1 hypothetical protein Mpt1_c03390 [Candidatus Methanoplasma termitum]MCL2334377.1 DUF5685 family protein [Candidatus Methanoplasma sp.]